ncbi:hypothetical protein HDU92_007853 [Lobulomyces angularis]|nr:hypothetical protein HDU92_007853 [Lobulomyces angularis]
MRFPVEFIDSLFNLNLSTLNSSLCTYQRISFYLVDNMLMAIIVQSYCNNCNLNKPNCNSFRSGEFLPENEIQQKIRQASPIPSFYGKCSGEAAHMLRGICIQWNCGGIVAIKIEKSNKMLKQNQSAQIIAQ